VRRRRVEINRPRSAPSSNRRFVPTTLASSSSAQEGLPIVCVMRSIHERATPRARMRR